MVFLRRLLPIVVGLIVAGAFWWQARSAGLYPWLVIAAVGLFVLTVWSLSWKRVPFFSVVARMGVSVLFLLSAGYALLLAEGVFAQWVIPAIAGGVTFVGLELLFLNAFLPARYPVNGLSHFNFALVPMALWCVQYASVGLMMFIHAPRWLPSVALGVVTAALFWATAHAEASANQRMRWTVLGAVVGVHLGILGAVLPLEISLHGVIAAGFGAAALRARRYGISPRLPRRLMWVEAASVVCLLFAVLVTGRWA